MGNELSNLIQDANLIVDCDEILVNISPYWVQLIANEEVYFKNYFDLSNILPYKDDINKLTGIVLSRKEFFLNKWLKREEIDSLPDLVMERFYSLYNSDGFYYNLGLTRMAVGLKKFSYHPSVRKIYVVTKCTEGKNYKSKEDLIRSLFPSLKLEIRKVPSGQKKSDYIKDIDIRNGFIFEDEISNMEDYLDNANISQCNIYAPKLGYNKPTMDLLEKCDNNNVCLSYY